MKGIKEKERRKKKEKMMVESAAGFDTPLIPFEILNQPSGIENQLSSKLDRESINSTDFLDLFDLLSKLLATAPLCSLISMRCSRPSKGKI